MPSSFIYFQEENVGFWVGDGRMQIVCSYLVQTIDELKSSETWLTEFNKLLKDNAEGTFPGWMHLHLSEYLIDEERKNYFIKIIDFTRARLKAKGRYISIDELNSFRVNEYLQGKWIEPAEPELFIKVLDLLESLIKGELKTRSDSPIDYI